MNVKEWKNPASIVVQFLENGEVCYGLLQQREYMWSNCKKVNDKKIAKNVHYSEKSAGIHHVYVCVCVASICFLASFRKLSLGWSEKSEKIQRVFFLFCYMDELIGYHSQLKLFYINKLKVDMIRICYTKFKKKSHNAYNYSSSKMCFIQKCCAWHLTHMLNELIAIFISFPYSFISLHSSYHSSFTFVTF